MKNIKKLFLTSTLMFSSIGFLSAMENGQPQGKEPQGNKSSAQIDAEFETAQAELQAKKEELIQLLLHTNITPEDFFNAVKENSIK